MANQAVRIAADADKYTLPAPAGFGGDGQAYTICLWAYPIFKGYYSIIWAMDDGTPAQATYLWLGIWFDGQTMRVGSYHRPGVDGPNPPPYDTWIFLAVTHTSAGFEGGQGDNTLYWAHPGDTSLTHNSHGELTDTVPSNVLHLGGTGVTAAEWFNGRIAAVKMWEAQLDEAELLGEMQSYRPTRVADLWANWTFWNGPQTVDDSGNGHTLTAGTAPTAEAGPPSIGLDPPAGFRVGGIWDDQNGDAVTDIGADGYTELEWSIQTVAPATEGDVYEFRVYADDTPLDTYTTTPRLELTTSAAFIYHGLTPIHAAYHGAVAVPPFAIHYG